MFEKLGPAPADPILGLTEAFRADPNPEKVNLGVGVYKDDEGRTPVLEAVKAAEAALLAAEETKSYLPIGGDPEYARQVEALVFAGTDVPEAGRACTVHTPGGTGALRVGAEFLRGAGASGVVWMSRPTWANHKGVFGASGFEAKEYAYYDAGTRAVSFAAMLEDLRRVPAGDTVLLHACCHNPSGADLDEDQWREVAGMAAAAGWTPFLDAAYLGFGDGFEPDAAALRVFAETGKPFLAAISFSKNLSLYRERVGALSIVAEEHARAEIIRGHVLRTIRVMYSNPAAHGGLAAARVLGDALLRATWLKELEGMRRRIHAVRDLLAEKLAAEGATQDFDFIRRQRGMFSFSGLSDPQVEWLREQKGIYIVKGGRINVAGLTTKNIDYVCAAIAEVLKTV